MAFYESSGFKYLKNLAIGLGAALIIVGALGKIMHAEWGNWLLPIAMSFEAGIFALQAILPPHKDYYWEKLYPGLDNIYGKVQAITPTAVGSSSSGSNVQQLNDALEKAGVNEKLIQRLGGHLNALGDNLNKLTEVTGTTGFTSEFNKRAQEATGALTKVKEAYEKAANTATELANVTGDTKKYHEQVQLVSKNLAALNAVYELELQDTNNHLKAMNKFYNNLTASIENLTASIDDSKRYKDQIAALAKNLSTLNNVYGNMLNAMSLGAKGVAQ